LAALARRAPIWAGLALLCAVVTKETSVLLVGVLAVATSWSGWTGRRGSVAEQGGSTLLAGGGAGRIRFRRSDLAFVIPLLGFIGWQLVLLAGTGRLPIYKSGGENLGVPLLGLSRGFGHYLSLFPSVASALWFGELGVLVLLGVGAAVTLHHAPPLFRLLWVASIVLVLSTASGIWLGDVGFRSLDDAYLMSWLVLLHRRQRLWPWTLICGITWVVVFVELVRYI
jgi:hypothetical protein